MTRHYDPNVAVTNDGKVIERSTGREVGTVKNAVGVFIRRYKTRPPKYYDGWTARTPGGATDVFHTRREAAAWLFERTRDRSQIRP